MTTHNIDFYEEISKIIPLLSSNTHLIGCTAGFANLGMIQISIGRAASPENLLFAYAKTKVQTSRAVAPQLISTFVFAT